MTAAGAAALWRCGCGEVLWAAVARLHCGVCHDMFGSKTELDSHKRTCGGERGGKRGRERGRGEDEGVPLARRQSGRDATMRRSEDEGGGGHELGKREGGVEGVRGKGAAELSLKRMGELRGGECVALADEWVHSCNLPISSSNRPTSAAPRVGGSSAHQVDLSGGEGQASEMDIEKAEGGGGLVVDQRIHPWMEETEAEEGAAHLAGAGPPISVAKGNSSNPAAVRGGLGCASEMDVGQAEGGGASAKMGGMREVQEVQLQGGVVEAAVTAVKHGEANRSSEESPVASLPSAAGFSEVADMAVDAAPDEIADVAIVLEVLQECSEDELLPQHLSTHLPNPLSSSAPPLLPHLDTSHLSHHSSSLSISWTEALLPHLSRPLHHAASKMLLSNGPTASELVFDRGTEAPAPLFNDALQGEEPCGASFSDYVPEGTSASGSSSCSSTSKALFAVSNARQHLGTELTALPVPPLHTPLYLQDLRLPATKQQARAPAAGLQVPGAAGWRALAGATANQASHPHAPALKRSPLQHPGPTQTASLGVTVTSSSLASGQLLSQSPGGAAAAVTAGRHLVAVKCMLLDIESAAGMGAMEGHCCQAARRRAWKAMVRQAGTPAQVSEDDLGVWHEHVLWWLACVPCLSGDIYA